MKYLIRILFVLFVYQFCYSKSNNNMNTFVSNTDTSKTILETNNIIQKSDIGLNLLVFPFIAPNFTYRNYLYSSFSLEVGLVISPLDQVALIKYGASLNYKRLFLSLVNYNILGGNLKEDIINSIYLGYIPINTGNSIDFNFRLGLIGNIYPKSSKGTLPNFEFGIKYNFYRNK